MKDKFYAMWRCGRRLSIVPVTEEMMTDPVSIDFARRSARKSFSADGFSDTEMDDALAKDPRFFVRVYQDEETYTEHSYREYCFLYGTFDERNKAA